MANGPVQRLLDEIRSRARVASIGEWFYRCSLVAGGLLVLGIALARLLALIPDYFQPWSVAIAAAVALLAALVLHRAPSVADAARMADIHAGSRDLFLTATMLEGSAGQYQPIVVKDADERARSVVPSAVLPLRPGSRAVTLLTLAAFLVLISLFVPQLDPFGKDTERKRVAERTRKLEEDVKQTAARAAAMKERELTAEHSEPVKESLEDLQKAFNQMKPDMPKPNLDKLTQQQKQVTDKWREKSEERLRDTIERDPMSQRFGGQDDAKAQQWKKELEAGKTDSLKKEIDEVKKKADEMAKEKDPAKKEELRREIEQRMKALQNFAQNQAKNGPMSQSLDKAAAQMQMSKMDGLEQKAMDAAAQSLDMSKMDADQMAQLERDVKAMEQAMQAIQNAKQANDKGNLDGSKCEGCKSMQDYMAMFDSMCQGNGQPSDQWANNPSGPNNGGIGAGQRPEAPSNTAFKMEKSSSQLQPGKILKQWKSLGPSDAGEANEQFKDSLGQIKQGVNEAILKEQVPPGYHDTIKQYFNTLSDGKTPPPAVAPTGTK